MEVEAARRKPTVTLRPRQGQTPAEVFRLEGQMQEQAWSVTGRLLDGPYPNYRQVIPGPEQFTTTVTLSDAALEAITRLVPRLPGKQLANRPVGLHCEKGRFGLLARGETTNRGSSIPWTRCEMKGTGPDRLPQSRFPRKSRGLRAAPDLDER